MDSRFFNDLIDDIQNTLSNRRLLFNQNNNSSRRSSSNNHQRYNNNNNNTNQLLYTLQILNDTMSDYNDNIRIFLEIIRSTFSSMQEEYDYDDNLSTTHNNTQIHPTRSSQYTPIINNQINGSLPRINEINNQTRTTNPITITTTTSRTSTRPNRPPNIRNRNDLISNPLFNAINNIFTPIFQDVVVRPTIEQITSATRTFPFVNNSDVLNTQCPITLEHFEDGQQICQITHCGHCFTEASIRNWFQRNVHCPVCRHDIRDYTETNNIDNSNNLHENVNSINGPLITLLDRLSDQFTDINNRRNPQFLDTSLNVIYTFEMPYQYLETYEYYDVSGNDMAT